jgi:signal transduction histidine kinase
VRPSGSSPSGASGSASKAMRRRLVAALVGVAVVTLLLYATPRAFAVDDLLRRQEEVALRRSADLMEQIVARRLAEGGDVDERLARQLAGSGEQVVVELLDGTVVRSGPVPSGRTVVVRRPMAGGGELTLRVATDAIDERIADAFTARLGTGLVVIVLAAALAIVLSRRLAQPFTALATYAERLGTDDDTRAPRSDVPEAERLADALDRSRERIAEMVRREREFSADASHQLRTPLTALRLRLEDLSLWPETGDALRAELHASIAEVDRLDATIDELLEFARSGDAGEARAVDLRQLVDDVVRSAAPRFEASDRLLVAEARFDGPALLTSPSAVRQILDVLVDNALRHGEGQVCIALDGSAAGATLRVVDEGRLGELDEDAVFRRSVRSSTSTGSGIGLALARRLAASIGGELRMTSTAPTTFELVVPERSAGPV